MIKNIQKLFSYFSKNTRYIVLILLIISALVRIWNLAENPSGLTPDEAALGYNAYSILNTGKDEHGQEFPLVFKSFGDYKPGLYVYLDIPFVVFFGLNEITVRLPSTIAGIFSVFLIYLIGEKMFGKGVALSASAVAAFNPYLIYFGRGAWEANVALTFTLTGIYFFLKAVEKEKYLYISVAFFALTLLTYQGAKISTGIVALLLIIVHFNTVRKFKFRTLIISFLIGLLLAFPIIISLFNGQTQRLAIFSVFSYPRPESEKSFYEGTLFQLFHSDTLNYLRMIMSRWFNFYSGQFLFFVGDAAHPAHTPPYQGVLLLSDLFLLPWGFIMLFKSRHRASIIFLLLWFLLAPFSAAISRDQTNAVRSLNASVPLILITAMGLNALTTYIGQVRHKLLISIPFAMFYLFSLLYFLDAYFVHFPVHNAKFTYYGYKEAVNLVNNYKYSFERVVFEQSFAQPYIYFLFHSRYDPASWQVQSNLVESEYKGDVGYEEKLDNIFFERLDWSKLSSSTNTLIVASPNSIPPEVKRDNVNFEILETISYPGSTDNAFIILRTI